MYTNIYKTYYFKKILLQTLNLSVSYMNLLRKKRSIPLTSMQSDIWSYIDMGNINSPKSRNETLYFSPNKNCKICDTSLLYKIYLSFNIISLILPYTVNLSYCTVKSNVQVNSYMSSTNLRMLQELNNIVSLPTRLVKS